jgi:hypothetical protein
MVIAKPGKDYTEARLFVEAALSDEALEKKLLFYDEI